MKQKYPFKVNWCKICDQGWVEIVRYSGNDNLFVKCRECDAKWDTPLDSNDVNKASLPLDRPIKRPTTQEVKERGWDKYIQIF